MKSYCVAVAFLGVSIGHAQEPPQFDHGELDSTLAYGAGSDRESVLDEPDFMEGYQAFKDRLRRDTGLAYMVEYAPITQWGSGSWHMDHELNVIGQWTAFETDGGDYGQLLAWYQNGQTLGGETTSEFQASLGVLSPLNGGTPFDHHNVLQHLAWEQAFGGGHWRVIAGKITSRVTFNTNRYAVSDREDFFSPMIVNNPVVTYTARNGIGGFAQHRQDTWYVSAMVRDADASSAGLDFDSLSSGNWETMAEIAATPDVDGAGRGEYRLTWSYTDAVGEGGSSVPSGWTLSLSADQDLGEKVGALLRYDWADPPLRDFDSVLVAGLQIKSPFAHPDDRWGIAYWTGEPTDPALRREHGIETFYRLQLTQRVELTPDLQLIFDPALATDEDLRVVFGLRLRMVF